MRAGGGWEIDIPVTWSGVSWRGRVLQEARLGFRSTGSGVRPAGLESQW